MRISDWFILVTALSFMLGTLVFRYILYFPNGDLVHQQRISGKIEAFVSAGKTVGYLHAQSMSVKLEDGRIALIHYPRDNTYLVGRELELIERKYESGPYNYEIVRSN